MTIRMFDNDTGADLGELSEAQLQFLIDQLEEESSDDQDYYLNPRTIALLKNQGADPMLMKLLHDAIGDKEGVEIRWERQD